MVSFSCESCGDVLTKKKLDVHRNRCHGDFTCLDCMVNFKGTEYRSHTSCISEAQKYQGKLYKEKKGPKPAAATSQALVPKKQMETPPEADNRVAVVEVVPRAPSPPPGFNVFDFLIQNGDAQSTHPKDTPVSSPSSSDSEDTTDESDSDSMEFEDEPDPADDAYEAAREYMKQEMMKQGYVYGAESAEQNFERFQTFTQLPPSPAGQSGQFYTPAPNTRGHQRNISAASMDSATKESNKKRKRGHPEDLDLSSARAYQTNGDIIMTDVPAPLHSGLTGGLNRMLSRPELPPSPPDMDSSPHSPLKRSKQAKETEKKTKDKIKKAEKETSNKKAKKEPKKEKSTPKEKTTSVVVKDPKTGQWVRRRTRKEIPQQTPATIQEEDNDQQQPARKQMKAIEYNPDPLQATPNNAVILHSQKAISRAELFLSTAAKDTDAERGCSINKALKRYHRERAAKKVGEEEKELWKVLRVRKNDRGELVLFLPEGQ